MKVLILYVLIRSLLTEPAEGTKKAAMDDVSLQMIAKHYGLLFNHHNPPKVCSEPMIRSAIHDAHRI